MSGSALDAWNDAWNARNVFSALFTGNLEHFGLAC